MIVSAMPPKTVALIAAVCLTTGWLLASVLMPPVARLQALPERRPARPANITESPAPYSERLKLRLKEAPLAPTPRRNPFVFGSRERVTGPATAGQPRRLGAPVAEAPVAAPVVGPPFFLSGIAASETPQGEVRTAVLSDGITVHLVKIGDSIGGYKVTRVTDDAVTLVNDSGTQYVLQLR